MLKRIMHFLIALVIGLALFCVFLMWRETSMLYYPDRNLTQTPESARMAFEDLQLKTVDGVQIHGWFIPAPARGTNWTVLLFHGNAGNIGDRLEKIAILRELGCDVCIIDYRGYGRSAGEPEEAGTYRDAQAAYDYLTQQRHVPAARLIVYGESLGSGVAVELATRVPVAGVIMDEPFTSIGDVAQKMIPILPIRYLVRNKYDNLGKIGRINAPLLVFHSHEDELFPYSYSERLVAAAREPKRLIALNGGHNDAFMVSADIFKSGLAQFLHRPK